MDRRSLPLLICLLSALAPRPGAAAQLENEHFSINLPDDFLPPLVSRMTSSVTYAYQKPGVDSNQHARLQISVISIPAWSREAGETDLTGALDDCLAMFMTEIARRQSGFTMDPPRSGELDAMPMRTVRWMGKVGGDYQTGILHCARDGRRLFVVHMQDRVKDAPATFAKLKASVATVHFATEQHPLAQR
jgi:hypothetical protein